MLPAQQNLLKLLLEVDEICHKHDITYYLAGGTALGAVRNNGFLPWDDDVDVYITRQNWEKLERVIDQELRPDRAFASVNRSDLYQNTIPRYVDKDTTAIYLSQALAGIACGQHIEFLIMDPVPRDPVKEKEFRELLLVYTELLTPYFVVNRQVVNPGSDFNYDLYQHYLALADEKGKEAVLKLLSDKIFSYPDTDEECEYYCLRWGLKILMYKREYYGTPRYEEFEGHMLPVASRAEGVFREAYGDTWMMIPEAQDQEIHSALRSQSLSYTNYLSDYMDFVDREKALADYSDYKRARMDLLIDKEQTVVMGLKMAATLHKLHLEQRLRESGLDPVTMLEEGRYDELRELFADYYSQQLLRDMVKWDVLIEIDPQVVAVAVHLLVIDGRYAQARRILRIWAKQKPMSPELSRVDALVSAVRDLSIALYDKKSLSEARSIIEQWLPKNPHIVDFQRYDLIIRAEESVEQSDLQNTVEAINAAMPKLASNWELQKALGDCYLKLGDRDQAIERYRLVAMNSRNGIMMNQIRKTVEDHDLPGDSIFVPEVEQVEND